MKYTIKKVFEKEKVTKKYTVEFTVKYYNGLSKKDEEKIYKIVRIIDSLGSDNIDETTDKDFRFQSDDDEGKEILKGVVEDGNVKEERNIGDDIDLKSVPKTERV